MTSGGVQVPVYAASQLAWPREENSRAFALLRRLGYTGVELVPLKAFASWDEATVEAAAELKLRLAGEGLDVPSMQAIFHGTSGLHVFRNAGERDALTAHILRCADLANALGAKVIVFGAPKLRDPGGLDRDRAWTGAMEYFSAVGDALAERSDVVLAIEPVAEQHGGSFLCTHLETAAFVAGVNRPRIRQQFDLGCWLTHEEDESRLPEVAKLAAHCHISAPHLGRIDPATQRGALRCIPLLYQSGFAGATSVEMLDGKLGSDWVGAIEQAAPRNIPVRP